MIKTKRLWLRKEIIEDASGIQKLLIEPEGRIFTGGIKHKSIEEIKQIIQINQNRFSLDFNEIKTGEKHFVLNVERIDNKNYIGYCGFQYCKNIGDIEICYSYLKENWEHGFGNEAANAVLEFGFNNTNLKKVYAAVNPNNIASEKILKRIGMTFRKKIEWPEQGLVNLYGLDVDEYKKKN